MLLCAINISRSDEAVFCCFQNRNIETFISETLGYYVAFCLCFPECAGHFRRIIAVG